MRVCVQGLWHLGSVTAACLASVGHEVAGLDFDDATIHKLQAGRAPLHEPGLDELIQTELERGRLTFSADPSAAMRDVDVLWITYDTPVDEADRADVGYVVEQVERMFPLMEPHTTVLLSSQVPVGTTRRIEERYSGFWESTRGSQAKSTFAYSPENLRLGKAIEAFLHPDRVIIGVRSASDRTVLRALLEPITDNILWMSVESAEMTKHAINAYLATSVAFTNELASICEAVGADAREVEMGLRSERRVGPDAYVTPGAAYAGGTLARDVGFLEKLGTKHDKPTYLLAGVRQSNDEHKNWVKERLRSFLGPLRGRRVAVWGLTYKPGTDTLRRSEAIELCRWLSGEGASIQAHDPVVAELPGDLRRAVLLAGSPLEAVTGAEALIVATEWPEYRSPDAASVASAMAGQLVVLDPNRFLGETLGKSERLRYISVGAPTGKAVGGDRER